MPTLRRDFPLVAGLALFLVLAVWAAVLVTSNAVNELLHQDAEAEGESWARYLAANVKDLGAIVAGSSRRSATSRICLGGLAATSSRWPRSCATWGR